MSEVALLSKPGLMEGEGCPRAVVMTRALKQQGVDSSPSHHKQGVGGTMITITGKAGLASKGPDTQRIMAMVDRTWHPGEQEIGTTKGTIQLVPAEQIRMNDWRLSQCFAPFLDLAFVVVRALQRNKPTGCLSL